MRILPRPSYRRAGLLLNLAAAFFTTAVLHAQTKDPAQPPAPLTQNEKRISIAFTDTTIQEATNFLAQQFEGVSPKVARLCVTSAAAILVLTVAGVAPQGHF